MPITIARLHYLGRNLLTQNSSKRRFLRRPFQTREAFMRRAIARFKVQARGVGHSDALTKDGARPGIRYPCVAGHRIVGVIDALDQPPIHGGSATESGIGWQGGHCGKCGSCRRGDFVPGWKLEVPPISYERGYAEYAEANGVRPIHPMIRVHLSI
jgi:D-arabinose 1-dehydrogenase-like Zn-dependent alcohol dehydrogenase